MATATIITLNDIPEDDFYNIQMMLDTVFQVYFLDLNTEKDFDGVTGSALLAQHIANAEEEFNSIKYEALSLVQKIWEKHNS